jgi:hypothetical protein
MTTWATLNSWFSVTTKTGVCCVMYNALCNFVHGVISVVCHPLSISSQSTSFGRRLMWVDDSVDHAIIECLVELVL